MHYIRATLGRKSVDGIYEQLDKFFSEGIDLLLYLAKKQVDIVEQKAVEFVRKMCTMSGYRAISVTGPRAGNLKVPV